MMFEHQFRDLPSLRCENINGQRFYHSPTGGCYPSVTSVLSRLSKDSIKAWRERVGAEEANKITQRASSRGTSVHKLCEQYIKNETSKNGNVMPDTQEMFRAIQPHIEQLNPIFCVEGSLFSDSLKVAGRTDCIAQYDGRLSVIDFKTSKNHKPQYILDKYFLQCTAYAQMWTEMFPEDPCNQIVLMITCDEGGPQIVTAQRSDYLYKLRTVIGDFYENRDSTS